MSTLRTNNIQNSQVTPSLLSVGTTSNHGLELKTNSITRVTLDTSGNLAISGALTASAGATINGGNVHSGGYNYTTNASGGFWASGAGSYAVGWYESSGSMLFRTATTNRLTIDPAGNLGLGVTPSAWNSTFKVIDFSQTASLAGSSGGANLFNNAYWSGTDYIYKTTAPATRYFQGSGTHIWYIAPSGTAGNAISFTQAMTLDGSGNLGLGVTPSAWKTASGKVLQIGTTAAIASRQNGDVYLTNNYYENTNGSDYYLTNDYASNYSQSNGAHIWYTAPSGTAGAAISWVAGMTLSADGNLLIGTQSLYSTSTATLSVGKIGATHTNTGVACLQAWNQATSGDNQFISFYTEGGGGAQRGLIDYNRTGGVTRYGTSSDMELKNIIGDAPIQKSIDVLTSTRIREYSWKDDETNKPQIGVIAQELYETFKGAVSVGGEYEETDAEGNTVTKYRPWAVDKTAFTFHLIAGFQYQQQQIQYQNELIQELIAKVSILESK
jgi:hypothetical protein